MSTDESDDLDRTDDLESTEVDDDFDVDDDDDVIYLVDDDGEESAWGFLGTVSEGDATYALLAPLDQLEDEESDTLEIALYRYSEDDDGNESFAEIEDDAERARVEALASKFLEDEGHIAPPDEVDAE